MIQILPETWINLELKWGFVGTVHIPQKNPVRGGGEGFVTNELPSAIYIYPLHPYTDANFDKFTKKWDLKAQSINEDLKAQFIHHETPWGEILTYKLPIYINIHPLHPKKKENVDELIKKPRFWDKIDIWELQIAFHMSWNTCFVTYELLNEIYTYSSASFNTPANLDIFTKTWRILKTTIKNDDFKTPFICHERPAGGGRFGDIWITYQLKL